MDDTALRMKSEKAGDTHIYSLGQAGFVIKSRTGQLLAIDPYLSDCVERIEGHMGYKRLLPRILKPDEIVFDAIIATHFHRDHFDLDAMPEMMRTPKTHLFCAMDCKASVRQLHLKEKQVTYVVPGDRQVCGDFTLDFIHCDHGTGAPQAVGVIVRADDRVILETGDTSLRLDWIQEYLSQGKPDVLIAPINGAYGNMNEEECMQLAKALKPGMTIPCHYGMFASHGGNPGVFYERMKEKNLPVYLMTQGEGIVL